MKPAYHWLTNTLSSAKAFPTEQIFVCCDATEPGGGLNAKDLDSRRRRGCGFLQRSVCPNRRRQRHQRWRRGKVGRGCDRTREHDCQGRHGEERERGK